LATGSTRSSKKPVGRLLLPAILLTVATAYQVRVAEFHRPKWFGKNRAWPPFLVTGQDSKIGFVDERTGIKEGDRLLCVNGRPMTGRAVFGEGIAKSHPGETMKVTVLRSERGQDSQKEFTLPLASFPWPGWWVGAVQTILLIVLPYLAVLVGLWVAAVRPRDPRAWLVLGLTGSYLGISSEDRSIEVLKECADLPAASTLSSIMQAADSFAAGAEQYDDMTLVVLRVLPHHG
jgi:hypothetical protein